MSLYRARPQDGVCVLTGASSGIGRAAALILARKGWTVIGIARSEDKLASLADEAEALPGRIVAAPCDVTDEDAMQALLERVVAEHGPIALAVFVAGNYWPVQGDDPDLQNMKKTYGINVFGTLNGLVPTILHMRDVGRGQIAVVGSVSAYGGLPLASAYGASKAALNNMVAALKFDLDKLDIRIQMINPGFVDTPLTEGNNFSMPFLMKVDDAAEAMVDGLENGGYEVVFPRSLATILKVVNLFPYAIYFPLMRRAMGWKDRKLGQPKHFFSRTDRRRSEGRSLGVAGLDLASQLLLHGLVQREIPDESDRHQFEEDRCPAIQHRQREQGRLTVVRSGLRIEADELQHRKGDSDAQRQRQLGGERPGGEIEARALFARGRGIDVDHIGLDRCRKGKIEADSEPGHHHQPDKDQRAIRPAEERHDAEDGAGDDHRPAPCAMLGQ